MIQPHKWGWQKGGPTRPSFAPAGQTRGPYLGQIEKELQCALS